MDNKYILNIIRMSSKGRYGNDEIVNVLKRYKYINTHIGTLDFNKVIELPKPFEECDDVLLFDLWNTNSNSIRYNTIKDLKIFLFYTKTNIPINIIKELSKNHPRVSFIHSYIDNDCVGTKTYNRGVEISSSTPISNTPVSLKMIKFINDYIKINVDKGGV